MSKVNLYLHLLYKTHLEVKFKINVRLNIVSRLIRIFGSLLTYAY